ncbi:unnamed protein product [Gulo gulo]|uniref:Uncharacterized protein n=1 Tax=Gulo gulo TaxID=48420 RepID=A0A9X9M027_GULGU|nr:unnamed protein product [Gulo gulo]
MLLALLKQNKLKATFLPRELTYALSALKAQIAS